MKKYFTKFLPFDGEIQAGDYGLSNNSKTLFKALPETMNLCKGRQKVKLFLCSRDGIQIGDIIKRPLHDGSFEDDEVVTDGKANASTPTINLSDVTKNGGFKVIGEVSPEATWVTEGMEFDEDQIEHGGWRDEELTQIICKIKCPTCNKFH